MTVTVRLVLVTMLVLLLALPAVGRAISRRRATTPLLAEGDNVRLRPGRRRDVDAVAASMDGVMVDTMGWTPDDKARFLDAVCEPDADPGAVNLVVERLTGDVVGVVSLVADPTMPVAGRHPIMLGFWVAPTQRGRGLGTEAVGLAHRIVAGLGGSMSTAHTATSNTATQAVLERNGFERHGSYVRRLPNGADIDAHMYRRFVT